MRNYYEKIADRYRELRTTDPEPVDFACGYLSGAPSVEACDMGCGVGRYAKLFFDKLGAKLFLHCFDTNEYMLNRLETYMADSRISSFSAKVADAAAVPLAKASVDAVVCFNSIHHIGLVSFLGEVLRILKSGGMVFIYTRSRSQNSRTVWGENFPLFKRRESRLYEPEEFEFKVEKFPEFEIEATKVFLYERQNSLKELMRKASAHHYSTFSFYEPEEFDRALRSFDSTLKSRFIASDVRWRDENTMYVLKKCA